MFYRGQDPKAILTKCGKRINTAGWGFDNWMEEYLMPILKVYRTSDIIAVWDGGNEYRKSLHPGYKKKRHEASEKAPIEEKQQRKLLENAIKVFLANIGVVNVQADGVEADDVIATICRAHPDEKKVIHTGDADMLQLDDENTYVYLRNTPIKGEHQGIPLNMTRLNKCLVGDKSRVHWCAALRGEGVEGYGSRVWLRRSGRD